MTDVRSCVLHSLTQLGFAGSAGGSRAACGTKTGNKANLASDRLADVRRRREDVRPTRRKEAEALNVEERHQRRRWTVDVWNGLPNKALAIVECGQPDVLAKVSPSL